MKSIATSAIVSLVILTITGCASVEMRNSMADIPNISTSKMIPIDIPMPIKTIEVYDKTKKKRVEADVLSLNSAEIRGRLTSTQTLIT
ncbi:MAG: hypothetical protein ACYDAI_13990 [Trichloromonadaceae bacterium]